MRVLPQLLLLALLFAALGQRADALLNEEEEDGDGTCPLGQDAGYTQLEV